ncbi:DUF1295 domain-containing protein [Nonomuraea sp. NPDC005650]|uniref:DUF1295 domain-containing protein n=1 Tax=Nonomuraea sp. NPDC005650 TaxID=3157045 RepID=UPI0033AFF28F
MSGIALAWSALCYVGFVAVLFLGTRALPGRTAEGAPLADGTRRRYRLNGLTQLIVLVSAAAIAAIVHPQALSFPYRHFLPLVVAANLFALAAILLLYLRGTRTRGYAPPGAKARLREAFLGIELNPTMAGVDLKFFSYRPSLLGLFLVNLSFAAAQFERHGTLTDRMVLYQAFWAVYLINHFQFERGMLYTWDIIAERFGGMLVWGDYVLVPFFYSLPGWFLVDTFTPLPAWAAVTTTLMFLFGFWLFRGANSQKHRAKNDPAARIWGRPARFTEGGLLVSGFWGIGRKLNYTGELLMYISWTALCGFGSLIPYLLPLWLTVLLVHRAWRDDRRCRSKYGPSWESYCRTARFRMIPFVY